MEKTFFINPASTELVLITGLATLFFFCVVPGIIQKVLFGHRVTKIDLAMLLIASLVAGGTMSYFTHVVFGWPLFTILLFAIPGFIYVVIDVVRSFLKAYKINTK